MGDLDTELCKTEDSIFSGLLTQWTMQTKGWMSNCNSKMLWDGGLKAFGWRKQT